MISPKLLPLLALVLLLVRPVSGQTTDPVGFYSLTLAGASDTPISIPMVQPLVYAGAVTGVGSTTLSAAMGTWTAGAYTYKSTATQTQTFYVEFTSGNLKGFVYRITANTDAQLALATLGDDLTSVGSSGGAVAGDSIQIRPYWRVREIFADVSGVPLIDPRPNVATVADELLFPNYVSVAQNKMPNRSVYYVTGQGWMADSAGATDPGDTILPPNEAVIVRRRNSAGLSLTVLGAVAVNRSVSFVAGGDGTNGNDTYISLRHPVPVSLDNSGLRTSDQSTSVIRDSSNALARQDELRVFPTGRGLNPSPSITYYYLANQGWRMVGSPSTTIGADVFLQPGVAYLVRKKAANPGVDWAKEPNF